MSKTQIFLIVAVALGSGAFAIYTWLGTPPEKQFHDPSTCPVCGKKLPRPDAPCPWCEQKKIQEIIKEATKGPGQQRGLSAASKVTILFLVSLLILSIGFWPQIRKLMRMERCPAETFLVMRCPNCLKKLRYFASKAGQKGVCPSCRSVCTFQDPEAPPKTSGGNSRLSQS